MSDKQIKINEKCIVSKTENGNIIIHELLNGKLAKIALDTSETERMIEALQE